MTHSITLKYSGPAADSGQMDAYEAAGNIIAFSDFLSVLAKTAYGQQARLKTEVRAFEKGSFAVNFALDMGGIMATLFSGVANPKDLYELSKHSFQAWKHLQGEDPKSVTHVDDRHIEVVNNHGQVATYRADTINIVMSPDAVAAASRFVSKALESDLDRVSIEADSDLIAEASSSEAKFFTHLVSGEVLTENVIRTYLSLESAVFKDGNKWKLSDGQTSFHASIDDVDFIARVESGEERFGKGDALVVEMRIVQSRTAGSFKTERSILKVHEHRTQFQQKSLLN